MSEKRPVRVVLADDDRDTVTTLAFVLGEEGYEVRSAYNGRDAISAVEEFQPDAVVLDLGMPGPSGWEVARAIRGKGHGPRPLMIAVSGTYARATDQMRTRVSGFDHFCQKPCSPDRILQLLARLTTDRG